MTEGVSYDLDQGRAMVDRFGHALAAAVEAPSVGPWSPGYRGGDPSHDAFVASHDDLRRRVDVRLSELREGGESLTSLVAAIHGRLAAEG